MAGAGKLNHRTGAGAEDGPVVRRTQQGWRVDGAASATAGDAEHNGHSDGEPDVLPDLVNAMVLADLLTGDAPQPRKPGTQPPAPQPGHAGTGAAASADSTHTVPGKKANGEAGTGRGAATAHAATAHAATAHAATAPDGATAPDARTAADGATAPDGADTTRLKATIAQLEHALATRVRIEQAIGILAERHRLTPRQAFELLRKVARSGGSRVHDLAGEVVASATNPLLLLPAELARQPLQPSARGRPRRQRPQ